LNQFPAVNAEIQGHDIIYKNYYNIGVAVGTSQGLVVPVLKNADKMSFGETEATNAEFGKRAKEGNIAMSDMAGGTFTISNGGVYGSLMSSPILNPPQSGILGMHKIQKRPVAIGDNIEIRPMMYLALSYDHRIIDGREAVSFLVRIKEIIEDPRRLVVDASRQKDSTRSLTLTAAMIVWDQTECLRTARYVTNCALIFSRQQHIRA
jgi:2-oxoglutarate dehydrogenase E2 component (dihydrolipoamide succinyltransferase)